MEQHPPEDHRRRRPRDRDSHTDLAYLIVAGLAVLLLVRFWQRNAQPAIAGLLQQLTWEDVATALTVLAVSLVAMVRVWLRMRRRRKARGMRLVDPPRHTRATDPMASGEKSSAQRPGQGWP